LIERKVTKRYVKGFLEAAHERNCVEGAEAALKNIDELLKQHREVAGFLYNPVISRMRKKKLLHELLGEGVPEIVKRFMDLIVDKKRERILELLYAEFEIAADELRGLVRARVKSGENLTAGQVETLRDTLGKMLDKKVELECEVDATLLGGLQVFLGTYVIDGSVTGRLERMQKYLLEEVCN
jgi:F-type H+-transporting ATPase subunit delta